MEKSNISSKKEKRRKKRNENKFLSVIFKLLSVLLSIVLVFTIITFAITYYSTNNLNIKYKDLIYKYSEENNLDPIFLSAIISTESSFKKDAISSAGAVGLMQLMPDTAKWLSDEKDIEYEPDKLKDPEYNIKMGSMYIRYLLDYYSNEYLALAAYNGGMGNVDSWLKEGRIDEKRASLDNIPIEETREYVYKIERKRDLLNLFYSDSLPDEDANIFKLSIDNYKKLIKRIIKEF